jgi:hypothetical protein
MYSFYSENTPCRFSFQLDESRGDDNQRHEQGILWPRSLGSNVISDMKSLKGRYLAKVLVYPCLLDRCVLEVG